MKFRLPSLVLFGTLLSVTAHAQVNQAVTDAARASVLVACDGRQGSGTVINGVDGYVITAGHVVMDVSLASPVPDTCTVAFADSAGQPRYVYQSSVIHSVYNEKLNQDFAILQIGPAIGRDRVARPFPSVVTNEFSSKGDTVHVIGYPGPAHVLTTTSGVITDYVGGFIDVTAVIAPGDSGGTGIDNMGRLIGMPTRILTLSIVQGTSTVMYELVDIRAAMNWLDTFGPDEHDKFFTHANYTRYHSSAVFITQDSLGCDDLARPLNISAVYCLMADGTRLAFPTDTTYFSWFPDFSTVHTIVDPGLFATYLLSRNVTFKPGTLVKLRTAPQTYVVIDSFGTLRWIPTEQKAIQLWGPAWAGLVRDVPDEFWVNYTIGQPLE